MDGFLKENSVSGETPVLGENPVPGQGLQPSEKRGLHCFARIHPGGCGIIFFAQNMHVILKRSPLKYSHDDFGPLRFTKVFDAVFLLYHRLCRNLVHF